MIEIIVANNKDASDNIQYDYTNVMVYENSRKSERLQAAEGVHERKYHLGGYFEWHHKNQKI